MLYKTIVLALLQNRPQMHEQLRRERMLLATMNQLAIELKQIHEAWTEQLSEARPDSAPSQIASEAMELALQDLEERLPSVTPPDESEPLSLDAAMSYIRSHTQPA